MPIIHTEILGPEVLALTYTLIYFLSMACRRSVLVKRPYRPSVPCPIIEPLRPRFKSRPGLKLFYIWYADS